MTKTFDIQKIHDHEEGWQDEWRRLLDTLLVNEDQKARNNDDDLTHWGPLGLACQALLRMKNRIHLLDDFITYVLDQYDRRVKKPSLFTRYNPEMGDPIVFLCSLEYLSNYLKKFDPSGLKVVSLYAPLEDELDEKSLKELADPTALTPQMTIFYKKLHKLYASLASSIVIRCPKPGSRMYEQAGLQLYPKLSIKNEKMVRLHDDTRQEIAEIHETTETAADSKIHKKHEDDSAKLDEKIIDLNLALKKNLYRNDDKRDQDAEKVLKLSKKLIFAPLSNASLVELLQMPAENVARSLSRYIGMLPFLFKDYQKIYDQIIIQDGETEDE